MNGASPRNRPAEPFELITGEDVLVDLRERLARTRLADDGRDRGWSDGVPAAYLRELVEHWLERFDWRAQEASIMSVPHYRVQLDDVPVHFVHVRGTGPAPLPIVLTHGWPWTFWDWSKVIGPLSDPTSFGADETDAFDVVVPSLPGFCFSSPLPDRGVSWIETADLWARLMTDVLGYSRFGAAGGDYGALVSAQLGHKYGEQVVGIHTLGSPTLGVFTGERYWDPVPPVPASAPDEQRERILGYAARIASHCAVHVLEPRTLAHAMHDSPAGLASWLVARRRNWSDCGGDVERRFTKDELLTTVMLYWVTETFASSVRYYREAALRPWQPSHDRSPVIDVPTGITAFVNDAPLTPAAVLQQRCRLVARTVRDSGGHFGPMEEPQAVVEDIRRTFRDLRGQSTRRGTKR
jgi:pimeloyl-ACP methyl ester carboxylesterase